MLLYDVEAWMLLWWGAAALGILERNVLHNNICPVSVDYEFRVQTNRDRNDIFNDMDAEQYIKIQRLRCLGRVVRMGDDVTARLVFGARISERRLKRWPIYFGRIKRWTFFLLRYFQQEEYA